MILCAGHPFSILHMGAGPRHSYQQLVDQHHTQVCIKALDCSLQFVGHIVRFKAGVRQNVRRCNNGKAGVEADIEAPKEILRQIKESSFSQDATKQPTCAKEMTRHNLCQARPKKGDNQLDELSIPFPNSRMQCHVIF